jgi:hypothetical protein
MKNAAIIFIAFALAISAPKKVKVVFHPPPIPNSPLPAAVTNEVVVVSTNPPVAVRTNFAFSWQATNGIGFTTYLVLSSTNARGPFTNVESQVTPDGLWHTNSFGLTNAQRFFVLRRF